METFSKDKFEFEEAKIGGDNGPGVGVMGGLERPGSMEFKAWEICLVTRDGG